jgi:hypothetical protein
MDPPATVEELLGALSDAELRGGPYAAGLAPTLGWLGAAQLSAGRYRDGVAALRRGIHLLRVNEGLYTPTQTGLIEQLIAAYTAAGDFVAADEQQEYLFRVRTRELAATDPDYLRAVERYADWLRTAYLGELDRLRYPRLVQLADLYGDAADAIAGEEGQYSRAMLPYLEGRLKTAYLISVYPGERESGVQIGISQNDEVELANMAQLRFMAMEDGNFRAGLAALRQREAILRRDPAARPEERAEARLALADWYQWHRRYADAIRCYREAWELMAAAGGEAWLRQTFADPLELPAEIVFNPGAMPLRTLNSAEVTMRFDVSRHGEAKDIAIQAPDPAENQPAITRGYHYLRNMRFRPRLEEGVVVAARGLERTYRIRY